MLLADLIHVACSSQVDMPQQVFTVPTHMWLPHLFAGIYLYSNREGRLFPRKIYFYFHRGGGGEIAPINDSYECRPRALTVLFWDESWNEKYWSKSKRQGRAGTLCTERETNR